MKHCFQAVNGECAAFFTPLHLKWWQPVDCDSAVFFSQTLMSDLQNEPGNLSSEPYMFIYFSVEAGRDH